MTTGLTWNLAIGIGLISALLVQVGAFMPWVSISAPIIGDLSVNGMDNDGRISLALGAAAFAFLLWAFFKPNPIPAISTAVLGAVVAMMMVWKIYDLASFAREIPNLGFVSIDGSIGLGIYASLIGGIAIAASGFWLTRSVLSKKV